MAGIQLIGMLFGIGMLYLTYVHYQKKDFTWRSALVWTAVWLAFIVIIILPESVYGIMQALRIERTADFFVMTGFVLFAVIIFYLFITVKRNERKVEGMVRALAFEREATKGGARGSKKKDKRKR
ncbi:DUF2304 domain-containing protein [Candidatus Woesearchaeota archaeon]|nr:DUF2304 domain-containing protein [Candidatus Woesearchaeota archaeon]